MTAVNHLPPVEVDDEVIALLEDDGRERIEFLGARFLLAPKMGMLPFLRFGYIATNGAKVDELATVAVVYEVIKEAIDDEDWDAFEAHAGEQHADMDDLISFVHRAMDVMSARPTRRPTGSSAGPSTTETSSSDDSSSLESLTPLQRQRLEFAPHLRPVG